MINAWARGPVGGHGDWASRPRYALSDFPTLLWRERFLIAAVFIVIFVLGAGFALTMKKSYEARSSVLVRLGQEYVYEPRVGDAARGAVPDTANVLESEVAILTSDALKERVVRHLTYARLDPKHAAEFSAAPEPKRQKMIAALVFGIGRSLGVGTGTDTPVIQVSYKDDDPERAALILNTLLEEYLIYRRSVLIDPTSNAFDEQRRSFQDRLNQADGRYQAFLTANGIGDFDSEKTSVSQLQAQVEQQRYATETQLKERAGRLAGVQAQLATVSPEISLYHDADITAQTRLADLKTQREQLLSRYRPEAQPVRDLEAQIAQLQAAVNAGRTNGQGAQRTSVNPVYQTLQTEKMQLTAEVAALRQSLDNLNAQATELTQRRLRLAELDPQNQSLVRERDVLQGNVRDFTVKAQQAGANQAIAATTNDNIRIVQRASAPTQGKSLKVPVLALSLMFALASGLAAGLLRLFLRPGLPTAASAARTLDLPVLGVAPVKAA